MRHHIVLQNRLTFKMSVELNKHLLSGSFPKRMPASVQNHLLNLAKKQGMKTDVFVNPVHNRNGVFTEKWFIYVTNSDFFNILIGLNPDGSKRIEYLENDEATDDWGADVEKELPPIIDMDEMCIFVKELEFTIPLNVWEPDYIRDEWENEEYDNSKLICHTTQKGIEKEDVAAVMKRFTTKGNAVVYGKKLFFPYVTFSTDRNNNNKSNGYNRGGKFEIKVQFHKGTTDALLASFMTRRITIQLRNGDPCVLSFYRYTNKNKQ